MAIIKIDAKDLEAGDSKTFWFDNLSGSVYDREPTPEEVTPLPEKTVSAKNKSNAPSRLKIQLGLNCNYSCSYCSQKAVARPDNLPISKIDEFIESIRTNIKPDNLKKIEMWGGEPFVYWKYFKRVVDSLKITYPEAQFSVITNGSLLDDEIVDYLIANKFNVAMSHDGPGQSVRGEDPLDTNIVPIKKLIIGLNSINRGFSFNSVLNANNISRKQIVKFFEDRFPDQVGMFRFGEHGFIRVHNEDGIECMVDDPIAIAYQRRLAWFEAKEDPTLINKVSIFRIIIDSFFNPTVNEGMLPSFCGMDMDSTVAVDLNGNVLTCQNVSAIEIADNGNPHKVGTISNLEGVNLNTNTHWYDRPHCKECLVVKSCKGDCMFMDGYKFSDSCNMSYHTRAPIFALWFEMRTGYTPYYIHGEYLPEDRRDIFGEALGDVSNQSKKKKVITLKVSNG